MAAMIKIKITEDNILGEVDTYILNMTVTDATEIDPNIFVVEYTKANPRLQKYEEEFHHVAYLPEMSSISTQLTNQAHQYIRQSKITRTYTNIERLEESKKVMLNDICNLLKAFNKIGTTTKESEILVTEDGHTCQTVDTNTITLNGEEIRW